MNYTGAQLFWKNKFNKALALNYFQIFFWSGNVDHRFNNLGACGCSLKLYSTLGTRLQFQWYIVVQICGSGHNTKIRLVHKIIRVLQSDRSYHLINHRDYFARALLFDKDIISNRISGNRAFPFVKRCKFYYLKINSFNSILDVSVIFYINWARGNARSVWHLTLITIVQ